jgi:hypothetical protein
MWLWVVQCFHLSLTDRPRSAINEHKIKKEIKIQKITIVKCVYLSYRQSVSPNFIHLDLKYTQLLFHFHDMFRFQKIIIKWISNINIIVLWHNSLVCRYLTKF